jgi:hypothetical protein
MVKKKYGEFWQQYLEKRYPGQQRKLSASYENLNYMVEGAGKTGVAYAVNLTECGASVQLEVKPPKNPRYLYKQANILASLKDHFPEFQVDFSGALELVESNGKLVIKKIINDKGSIHDETTWPALLEEITFHLEYLKFITRPYIIFPRRREPQRIVPANTIPEAFPENNKQNFCSSAQI